VSSTSPASAALIRRTVPDLALALSGGGVTRELMIEPAARLVVPACARGPLDVLANPYLS